MIDNLLPIMTRRKKHNLQHKGKHKNAKEAYKDGLKSIINKVGFVTVFMNISRRGALHGYLMSINNQQPSCTSTAYRNQTTIIKNCLEGHHKKIKYPE